MPSGRVGGRHLELRNLIFTKPKLFEVDQCVEVLDFLEIFFFGMRLMGFKTNYIGSP